MENKIDELILESLSFYEPLTLDQVILDLDHKKVKNTPELNLDIFEKRIKLFVKTKKVKILKSDCKVTFIKLFPKRKSPFIRSLIHSFEFLKQKIINFFSK